MADKKTAHAASASLSAATLTPQPTTSPAASLTATPARKPTKEPKSKDSEPKDPKPVREPKPAKDAKAKDAKQAKDPKPQPPAADGTKLTAKQLKEQKKAEKAARRADTRAVTGGIVKTIYPTGPAPVVVEEVEVVVERLRDNGLVGLLKDLAVEQQDKKKTTVFGIGNAHPNVHPAILTLGMQINQYVLAGSTARCLGFLLAMKRVCSVIFYHSFQTMLKISLPQGNSRLHYST